MARSPLRFISGLILVGLFAGCTLSPTQPDALGVTVTFTYHSVVPGSVPWPNETCGDPGGDRRPAVLLNWTSAEVRMEPDVIEPSDWRATVLVPTNMRLDVTLRDPGLCRVGFAPYGEFAWSGLSVNGISLPMANITLQEGRPPCFAFRVGARGEVELESNR